MFCGNCGKQIPDGSGFCPSCGAAAGAGGATAATGGTAPTAAAAQRAKIEAQLKAGSQDAVQALKVLATDPVGGLPKSFGLFDEGRALIVGGIFAVVFALCMMLAAARGASGLMFLGGGIGAGAPNPADLTPEQLQMMARAGFAPPSTFSIMMKGLLAGLVFAAALIGSAVLARIIFKGANKVAGDVYIAGASLLPLSIFFLVALALGMGNYQIVMLVMVFALCYTVLMLYNGLAKIGKVSDGKAALSVPIMLVISMFVLGIIARSLF